MGRAIIPLPIHVPAIKRIAPVFLFMFLSSIVRLQAFHCIGVDLTMPRKCGKCDAFLTKRAGA
jgi:hypothetical protein